MFPRNVLQLLCFSPYVPQSLCSPEMFPSPYAPQLLCFSPYWCSPKMVLVLISPTDVSHHYAPVPRNVSWYVTFGGAGRPENKSGENKDWGISSCNIQTRDNIWDHKTVKHLWEIWGLVNIGTCKHRDCGNIENIESGEYTDWLNIGLGSNIYLQMVLGNISGKIGTGEHANWRI